MSAKAKKGRKYKVSPLGTHVKNCIHESLVVRNSQIVYEKWLFAQADFPCGSCGNSRDVVFMRVSPLNVVVRSCEYCGTTEPIIARHPVTNDPIAHLLGSDVISPEEARAVIRRNGMKAKFLMPTLARIVKSKPKRPMDLEGLELETE